MIKKLFCKHEYNTISGGRLCETGDEIDISVNICGKCGKEKNNYYMY